MKMTVREKEEIRESLTSFVGMSAEQAADMFTEACFMTDICRDYEEWTDDFEPVGEEQIISIEIYLDSTVYGDSIIFEAEHGIIIGAEYFEEED